MDPSDVIRVNEPHAIGENIEGEVVIINLDTGTYYSTDRVGATLWGLIENRCGLRTMQAAIKARFEGDGAEIEGAVTAFISKLRAEELVAIVEEGTEPPDGMDRDALEASPLTDGDKPVFEPPVLNKYRDMQDMLLLDPIHDVEQTGWPQPKKPDE